MAGQRLTFQSSGHPGLSGGEEQGEVMSWSSSSPIRKSLKRSGFLEEDARLFCSHEWKPVFQIAPCSWIPALCLLSLRAQWRSHRSSGCSPGSCCQETSTTFRYYSPACPPSSSPQLLMCPPRGKNRKIITNQHLSPPPANISLCGYTHLSTLSTNISPTWQKHRRRRSPGPKTMSYEKPSDSTTNQHRSRGTIVSDHDFTMNMNTVKGFKIKMDTLPGLP
ncbi:hypothetical protein AMECASPLE_033523 [Ameca splendens]|uniref:Uncharacterized protein n=1 Tax=Ameca splendens TaxID=208324 RepID=A0ABV0XJS9_9TELE